MKKLLQKKKDIAGKRIFIDTNVFLDMYRSNIQSDINTLMRFLYKNKKYLITTEQSINEFSRNRYTILNESLESFKKTTNIDKGSSTFLRSLNGYKKYEDSLKRFREQRQAVIEEIQGKIESTQKDDIYLKFKRLWSTKNIIKASNEIIDAANRRKISGNPPTSDKYTCGDEIIWESLLEYEAVNKEDLIIVSKDKTFIQNREFLSEEYLQKTGRPLFLCQDILEAYSISGIEFSCDIEQAEENLKWTDIIITALNNLGGVASLSSIYSETNDILYYNLCESKMNNRAKESTIRGVLQRFSSDFPNSYNGKKDLFHQVREGIWALR